METTLAATGRDHARSGRLRPDVEGLRAIAVVLVLLYHAGVPGFAGGYIGVDVFFVISGFLITGLLYRELGATGRISFRDFYVRRVRRLFPAASVALLVTFLLSAWLLSPLALPRVAGDGVAAALSVANIRFALASGDYFTAVATPSPFLHYWSLSVEEQFYLVWPALLLIVHRLGGARAVVAAIVGITIVSLTLAVVMTEVATTWAFYSLVTRAWQLAVGGLLAILALHRWRSSAVSGVLAALGWAGLAMILAGGFLFDELLAYPGAWALLPTLGAVLIIAGGDRRLGPGLLLQTRPLRFLGRISYALYLWHWPLLVLPAVAYGEALPAWALAGLVLLAVAVATVSTLVIEEPIRRRVVARPGRAAVGMAARPLLGLALAVTVGVGATHWVTSEAVTESEREVAAADESEAPAGPPQDIEGEVVIEGLDALDVPSLDPATPDPTHTPEPGASPLSTGTAEPTHEARTTPELTPDPTPKPKKTPKPTPEAKKTPKPTPVVRLPKNVEPKVWNAAEDAEILRKNDCLHWEELTSPKQCVFGKTGSRFTVALVGDSHASHWFPALRRVAEERGWRLETYVKVSCPFTDILVRNLEKKKRYTECLAFNENVAKRLKASKPDLVVAALSRWQHPVDSAYASPRAQGDGMARMLNRVPGRKVVLADVPYPGRDVPECLAKNIKDVRPCAVSTTNRVSGGSPARERQAAKASGGVMLNLNDLICGGKGRCPAVRNDTIVYRDHHHLTATFARTLAPALERALSKVVKSRKR